MLNLKYKVKGGNKMQKVVLQLDELTCPSCLTKIEGALKATEGVESVKVLFNAGKVKMDVKEGVDAEDLAKVVDKLGYKVLKVKVK